MVDLLANVRARGGRLSFLGVDGSAANASHAVNDFRKTTGMESYAPTDNVSELTVRTNDEGWASVFVKWLKGSRLQQAVIWHLLVSHPKLKLQQTKWEAVGTCSLTPIFRHSPWRITSFKLLASCAFAPTIWPANSEDRDKPPCLRVYLPELSRCNSFSDCFSLGRTRRRSPRSSLRRHPQKKSSLMISN